MLNSIEKGCIDAVRLADNVFFRPVRPADDEQLLCQRTEMTAYFPRTNCQGRVLKNLHIGYEYASGHPPKSKVIPYITLIVLFGSALF